MAHILPKWLFVGILAEIPQAGRAQFLGYRRELTGFLELEDTSKPSIACSKVSMLHIW